MISIEGNIVNKNKIFRGRIEIDQSIQGGIINKIGSPTGVADFIFKDELIFPGFVDLHVHARECADHSQDYKEDFSTVSEAAIAGGVVAIADMPNNPTPPIDENSYTEKQKLAAKSKVEVVLYAGIGPQTRPLSKKVPYKVFMGKSIGDLFFNSLAELEKVISNYQGESISFHCEDPVILEENKNKETHLLKRPQEAETKAIDFALELIKKYNLAGKICHCSTREGIENIKEAKSQGVNVSVEVSPHHLYFHQESLTEVNQSFMQMNPPLRTKTDSLYLIEALRDGDIDFLATDHAPHTVAEKIAGTSGTPQLDTYGPIVTWLIKEHGFTPERIAEVCSFNPGQFISRFTEGEVKGKYGEIAPGFTASLTILDLNNPIKITKDNLKTKAGWSNFEGITFPGRVVMTIVKGKVYEQK